MQGGYLMCACKYSYIKTYVRTYKIQDGNFVTNYWFNIEFHTHSVAQCPQFYNGNIAELTETSVHKTHASYELRAR